MGFSKNFGFDKFEYPGTPLKKLTNGILTLNWLSALLNMEKRLPNTPKINLTRAIYTFISLMANRFMYALRLFPVKYAV